MLNGRQSFFFTGTSKQPSRWHAGHVDRPYFFRHSAHMVYAHCSPLHASTFCLRSTHTKHSICIYDRGDIIRGSAQHKRAVVDRVDGRKMYFDAGKTKARVGGFCHHGGIDAVAKPAASLRPPRQRLVNVLDFPSVFDLEGPVHHAFPRRRDRPQLQRLESGQPREGEFQGEVLHTPSLQKKVLYVLLLLFIFTLSMQRCVDTQRMCTYLTARHPRRCYTFPLVHVRKVL